MRSILFDVDDTLYDRMDSFLPGYLQYLEKYVPDVPRRTVFNAFIRRGNEVYEDAMSGRMSMEEMYIFRISAAMEDCGGKITPEEALGFQAEYQKAQKNLHLLPGLAEALTACAERGDFLGVVTNGKVENQMNKCRSLRLERWIPDEQILPSMEIGISKPDPRIFAEAQRRWDLDPEGIWYVGDSYENDICGARGAGWHTVWYDILGRSQKDPSLTTDKIVHTPEELCRVLTEGM